MKISAWRNRLAVAVGSKNGINEVLSGGTPFHWNGSAVQFEIAFFRNSTLIDDLSNIDQVQIELKRADDRTGEPVMAKVLASADLNGALTADAWAAGGEDDCHALISFTGAEADLDLEGEETGEFWLVISALRSDGEPITTGASSYAVEEDGRGSSVPAAVVTPTYLTLAQSDARYVMAIDLTVVESEIATLQTQMTTANANITSVTTTANAALPKAGGTLTGALVLSGAPTLALHAATKTYVDGFLPLGGGTLTGLLTLSGAPTSSLHAATKAYVDLRLAVAGGTMTGDLILPNSTAGTALKAATQGYVNTAIANLVNSSPGALDTLNELATALGNDANFSTTMTTALAGKLALAGGTMTGHISLYTGTNPTGAQALSKGYADTLYLPLSGGTVTGNITASTVPSTGSHLTNKTYVDGQDALRLALTGGTLSGALNFSGTGHAGLTVNSLTTTQRNALAAVNGMLIYNSTSSVFERYEGSTWKQFSSGTSVTLRSASGAPGGGLGIDGDFYVNEDDGTLYKKSGGSWSAIVAARLPLGGGVVTGALNINYGAGGRIQVDGVQVVGQQQAAITAPTGGGTVDSQARTAIATIITTLQTHGLTA